ncbi:MAG: FtsX-like permease family protein [Coriobacteriales bacterium]
MRSLKMHKVQSLSIALTVMLSAAVLTTFGLVYGGVMQGVQLSEEQGGADVMAVPADAANYLTDTELLYSGAPAPIYMSADKAGKITDGEGVERITPQFYGQTLNSACCSSTGATRLIGIDFSTDFIVRPLVPQGTFEKIDREHSIIVGSQVGGVYEGSLRILGSDYTVVAVMEETGTSFDASIVADIDLVRSMARTTQGYEDVWERYGDPSGLVSCFMIDVADDAPGAREGANLTAVTGRIKLAGYCTPVVRSEVVDESQAQLHSVFALLAAAALIMVAVTLLQLFSRFYSCVWDRKAELSLYRAVGASIADVRRLIGGEIGVLVGSGLAAGLVLGFVCQFALVELMEEGLSFPYVALEPLACAGLALGVAAVFALLALASIAWPLSQIAKLDPSTAMQQGDID